MCSSLPQIALAICWRLKNCPGQEKNSQAIANSRAVSWIVWPFRQTVWLHLLKAQPLTSSSALIRCVCLGCNSIYARILSSCEHIGSNTTSSAPAQKLSFRVSGSRNKASAREAFFQGIWIQKLPDHNDWRAAIRIAFTPDTHRVARCEMTMCGVNDNQVE